MPTMKSDLKSPMIGTRLSMPLTTSWDAVAPSSIACLQQSAQSDRLNDTSDLTHFHAHFTGTQTVAAGIAPATTRPSLRADSPPVLVSLMPTWKSSFSVSGYCAQ